MIELNLLPDVKKEFIRAQHMRNTVISVSILVTIIAGSLLFLLLSYVFAAQPLIQGALTGQIKDNHQKLQDIPEVDKYLTVQNQLNNIQGLHEEKSVYSRLFGYLQQLNPAQPNNVAFSAAVVDEAEQTITVEGTARNFQAVNVFKNTLENAELSYKSGDQDEKKALFTDITLEEAALSEVNGISLARFKFTLGYTEEAFGFAITDTKVSIPSLVTSDADRNAPKEVFGEQPEGL